MIWNPWKRIRQLMQDAVVEQAVFDQRMQNMEQRLWDAENDAFYRAFNHYQMKTIHLRDENEKMMKTMIGLSALSPTSFIIKTKA